MVKKIHLVPLGCPKAMTDAEEILANFVSFGFQNTVNAAEADLIIINTCSFIKEAKEEAISTIFEYADFPKAKIVVSGCLPQRYPGLSAKIPEVHAWLDSTNRADIKKIIDTLGFTTSNSSEQTFSGKRFPVERGCSAYLKLSEGCTRRCSFCSIPGFKGNLVSKKPDEIILEAEQLIKEGVREINLVSQDTSSYGSDLYGEDRSGKHLKELLKELLPIKNLLRLRIMYLYPKQLKTEFYEFMAEQPGICNYIDMPMQHCNREILKRMGRPGSSEDYYLELQKIRQIFPDVAIRSAFITGFPGETEQQHQELLKFIELCRFDWLGIFAYSREEGTIAATYKNRIHHMTSRKRKRELLLKYENARNTNTRLPKIQNVLLEENIGSNQWLGRSEFQAPEVDGCILVKNYCGQVGELVKVSICGESNDFDLEAEVIK
jgi:ribosomal protein S12 methylthiotransferase